MFDFQAMPKLFQNDAVAAEEPEASKDAGKKTPEVGGGVNARLLQAPVNSHQGQEKDGKPEGNREKDICGNGRELPQADSGTTGAYGELTPLVEKAPFRHTVTAAVCAELPEQIYQ